MSRLRSHPLQQAEDAAGRTAARAARRFLPRPGDALDPHPVPERDMPGDLAGGWTRLGGVTMIVAGNLSRHPDCHVPRSALASARTPLLDTQPRLTGPH